MYIVKPRRKYIRKIKNKLVRGYKKKNTPYRLQDLKHNKFLIQKHRDLLMHSLFNRIYYKTFEGHQYYIAHERKYTPSIIDKDYFKRYKEKFLYFARDFVYRFKMKKEQKSKFFWNVQTNFAFHPHVKYKLYNQVATYYTSLLNGLENTKATQGFASNYFSKIIVQHYKGTLFTDQYSYLNSRSNKWGRVTAPVYKSALYSRFWSSFKYNYLYFNISVLRYLQYKLYLNKLIDYLYTLIHRSKIDSCFYGKILKIISILVGKLTEKYNKLNHYIAKNKLKLGNYFIKKSHQAHKDKRMLFVFSRLKLSNIRQIYLSYLKNLLIRYFKINLHLKFTKTNIFITVTNYKGDVRYRHSIGLIGYKKDQKKTYYAAKELIKDAIPRLFSIFKIKNVAILNSFSFVQTDMFKMYTELLNLKSESYSQSIWDYGSKNKAEFEEGFRKIIAHTMRKYITLRIILRGSKSKLKGLMRKVFKELKYYRELNNKYLVRILFLALNTKPHNGCRSPKKGRRRTKRRKQRLRFKLLDRQYEFQQRILKKQLYWRRKFLRMYKFKPSKNLYKNPFNRRSKKEFKKYEKNYTISNFQHNITSSIKYNFIYPNLKRRKQPSNKRLPRKYRVWRDYERWSNPLAIEPVEITVTKKRLKKTPQFYRIV